MGRIAELMSLFWTHAGMFPGEGEISNFDFKDRVESAARAGFKGIGLWHTDLEHCMLHRPLNEMKRILDDNGIKYVELEFLTDWFTGGERRNESDRRKKRLLEASQALRAKHIKIGDFYNISCPMERVTEEFAALCSEAERYDATIGFEFMGCSMINNLGDALSMVQAAQAKNGGIIIDIVQVMNMGFHDESLQYIPREYLVSVELNDGFLPGHPCYDPSGSRKFCGEGSFDIKGFIQNIRSTGYAGPWAVEVMSKEYSGMSLDELNTRAFRTTLAQFQDLQITKVE